MKEILVSQKKMLERLGQTTSKASDVTLAQNFDTHLQKIMKWIAIQQNIECLYVNYNAILEDVLPCVYEIKKFLQRQINIEEMVSVVDKSLYRNRSM